MNSSMALLAKCVRLSVQVGLERLVISMEPARTGPRSTGPVILNAPRLVRASVGCMQEQGGTPAHVNMAENALEVVSRAPSGNAVKTDVPGGGDDI